MSLGGDAAPVKACSDLNDFVNGCMHTLSRIYPHRIAKITAWWLGQSTIICVVGLSYECCSPCTVIDNNTIPNLITRLCDQPPISSHIKIDWVKPSCLNGLILSQSEIGLMLLVFGCHGSVTGEMNGHLRKLQDLV
jgi:hypothetical protein